MSEYDAFVKTGPTPNDQRITAIRDACEIAIANYFTLTAVYDDASGELSHYELVPPKVPK